MEEENKKSREEDKKPKEETKGVNVQRRPSIIKIWTDNPKLLLPYEDNYEDFREAVFLAFDIQNRELFKGLIDRDYLWMGNQENSSYVNSFGEEIKTNTLNWFQFIGSPLRDEREVVPSVLSYLFTNKEPYYEEPFDFTEKEAKLRREFYERLKVKYKSGKEYIKRVKSAMFDSDLLSFDEYEEIIDKKVFKS